MKPPQVLPMLHMPPGGRFCTHWQMCTMHHKFSQESGHPLNKHQIDSEMPVLRATTAKAQLNTLNTKVNACLNGGWHCVLLKNHNIEMDILI